MGMIPARENDSYYEVAYKARKQTVISAKNLMEKHPGAYVGIYEGENW